MKISKSILALGAVALFAAGQSYAQPGSRVCGWFSAAEKNQKGHFAFVYESREADVSDKKQCEKFIDEMKNAINTKKELEMFKSMPWDKVGHGTKCETLGAHFVDGNKYKSNDMCDNMAAKGKGYMVMKTMQMDQATGKPVLVNGKPVISTTYKQL